MNKAIQTHSFQQAQAFAPLAQHTFIFDLFKPLYKTAITSIMWNLRIWEVGLGQIPIDNNTVFDFNMFIRNVVLQQFTGIFDTFFIDGVAGAPAWSGNGISLFTPNRKYTFNGLYYNELLRFSIIMVNNDPFIDYMTSTQVIVETETIRD